MCTKVYALVLMLFAAVSVYGQDNVIDEVVWVVGDEAILKSDVENERLNAQYEGRSSMVIRIVLFRNSLLFRNYSFIRLLLIVLRFPNRKLSVMWKDVQIG